MRHRYVAILAAVAVLTGCAGFGDDEPATPRSTDPQDDVRVTRVTDAPPPPTTAGKLPLDERRWMQGLSETLSELSAVPCHELRDHLSSGLEADDFRDAMGDLVDKLAAYGFDTGEARVVQNFRRPPRAGIPRSWCDSFNDDIRALASYLHRIAETGRG